MQKQSPRGVLQKGVLKNFAKFLRKYLRQSLRLQVYKFIKKEALTQAFPFEFWEIFNTTFLIEHLCWLLPKMKYDTMILMKSDDPVKFVDKKKRLVIMYQYVYLEPPVE